MKDARSESGGTHREMNMNTQSWIRQAHRWLSIVFTSTVIANFVALALTSGAPPPAWITYSPLPPLLILMLSGLYLFALPYVVRRRG
jgi:hypothetical protein